MALRGLEQQSPERILDSVRILELANKAYFLYLKQPPADKAKLLRIVLSNCKVGAASVRPTYRKPFNLIFQRAKTVARRDGQRFDCATWLHKAKELPKEAFKQEVERHLTGQETEPWEIIYFKLYKSQLPIVERALEIAALMLGSDKSRGYSLEMICADFLAGAALETGGSGQNLGCKASSDYSVAASELQTSTTSGRHE